MPTRPRTFSRATGAAAIAESIPARSDIGIRSVRLNLSAAPTTSENFTVTINSNAGSAYDLVLLSEDLSVDSVTDLLWIPAKEVYIAKDDVLDIAWTNTNTRTWGLEVVYTQL